MPSAPYILLTHAYFLAEDPKEQVIRKPYPPLGILYLSAWLEQHGIEQDVFDTTFSTFEALISHIERRQPVMVALYTNLMTKVNVLKIIQRIRAHSNLAGTCIVLGGPDVTYNTTEYLNNGADVLVLGEGEQTLLELVRAVQKAGEFSIAPLFEVTGLAFLLQDGSVHQTPARIQLREIDSLPVPNRSKIRLQDYLDTWKNAHGYAAISLSTQRGCPYTCRWCSTAVYGQSYRRRSPAAVVDEIVGLQAQYDFDMLWFVDDVFTISHQWLQNFCLVLEQREVRIRYECITRADRMNEDVVELLKKSGCFRVWIGAESGSQRIIDAMDRRVEVTQVRDMIQATVGAGMEAGTFIMLGYPGETDADIQQTVAHLKAANPTLFTITLAYPIKGTGLYESVRSRVTNRLSWEKSSDRDVEFQRTYPKAYYTFAVRWAVNAVHFHQMRLRGQAWQTKAIKLFFKAQIARWGMLLFKQSYHTSSTL